MYTYYLAIMFKTDAAQMVQLTKALHDVDVAAQQLDDAATSQSKRIAEEALTKAETTLHDLQGRSGQYPGDMLSWPDDISDVTHELNQKLIGQAAGSQKKFKSEKASPARDDEGHGKLKVMNPLMMDGLDADDDDDDLVRCYSSA